MTATTTNNNRRKLNLLDCQLPERDTSNIRSILKANNMPFHVPERGGWDFNCWGFVALNFGWTQRVRWVDTSEMESYLYAHTAPIVPSEATVGDIAVFRDSQGVLKHTALMTCDPDIVCHKVGSQSLAVDTLENACRTYTPHVTYVRPKDSKLIGEKVEESC
jgi:hypothetical protein